MTWLPSGRAFGIAAAVSVTFVVAMHTPALAWVGLGLDLLLLAAVIADARIAARHPVRIARTVPDTVYQGQPAGIEVTVDNPGERTARLRCRELLAPNLLSQPYDFELSVPPGRRSVTSYDVVPTVRGPADIDPMAVRVLGPLGLAWAGRSVSPGQRTRVFPKIRLHGGDHALVQRLLQRRTGDTLRNLTGVSTEVHALRDYVAGDEYRHIDWKATAKRQRPVTREHSWSQHNSVVILIDCGRPMAALDGGVSKADHALSAALHLLRVAHAQHDTATLVLFSKDIRRVVVVDQRTRTFRDVFDRVYADLADLQEPDYGRVAAWVRRRVARRSLVLVCTSIIDLVRSEMLATALVDLGRRHRPVLVDLEDPGLVGVTRGKPSEPLEAYAKVVAMEIREGNRRLAARLKGQGVEMLSLPASELTVGLIRRYLELKQRG